MPEKIINEINFRGVRFTEYIRQEWTPGSGHGMLTWECGMDKSALHEPFDPADPKTLEDARTKIQNLVLYILPADVPRAEPKPESEV